MSLFMFNLGDMARLALAQKFTEVAAKRALEVQQLKHNEEVAELRRQLVEIETSSSSSTSFATSSTALAEIQIGPKEFIGPNIFERVKNIDTIKFRQLVARLSSFYPTLGQVQPIQVSANAGRVSMYVITESTAPIKQVPVLFFVPGTGLQVSNSEINNMIASQLRFAQNDDTQAVSINHRLCPDVFWPVPITDTVTIMRYYIAQFEPTSITIVGYSSGGLIASLAAVELQKNGHEVSTLVLQAPESDVTREFRSMGQEAAARAHRSFLPKIYQNSLVQLSRDNETAENDGILNEKTVDFYVREMFAMNPSPPLTHLRNQSLLWQIDALRTHLRDTHVVIATGIDDYFLPENNILIALLKQADINVSTIHLQAQDHSVFWQRLFSHYLCMAAAHAAEPSHLELNEAECDTFAEQEARVQFEDRTQVSDGSTAIESACSTLRGNVASFFHRRTRNIDATVSNEVDNSLSKKILSSHGM